MPRTNHAAIAAVGEVAAAQDGLITAAQLLEIGVDPQSRIRRPDQSAPWRRVLPGLYAVHGGELSEAQRLRAALLYAREPAAFTGLAALHLRGVRAAVRPAASPIHVLIPNGRRRSGRGFVQVERALHWPELTTVQGWPVTPIARAAIDACRRISRQGEVDALLAELVQSSRCTAGQLAAELAIAQRRGTALARRAVERLAAGPASAPELRLYDLWSASDLPPAIWNADLRTPEGEFIARPDAYLADAGVAVEVDSVQYHFGEAEWDRTMRRHAGMSARGLIVLHVAPRRIADDWDGIRRDIRAAVAAQAGRDHSGIVVAIRIAS